MMRRVFLETPYAGDVATNLAYARACAADCIRRGEAPFGSHLLYTQEGILDDNVPEERARGIEAGQAFLEVCAASVVYLDRGISGGMQLGIDAAERLGIPVELRKLGGDWPSKTVPAYSLSPLLHIAACAAAQPCTCAGLCDTCAPCLARNVLGVERGEDA
jgi:hypothetical protein